MLAKESLDDSIGATVTAVYKRRSVTVYPLYEQEIEALSYSSTGASNYLAVGLSVLTFSGGIIIAGVFTPPSTPLAELLMMLGAPIVALTSAAFLIAAWRASRRRKSMWEAIKVSRASDILVPIVGTKTPEIGE